MRLGTAAIVLGMLAVLSAPVHAAPEPDRTEAACVGSVFFGRGACASTFVLPSSATSVWVDLDELVARFDAEWTTQWEVSAVLLDAAGEPYLSWRCAGVATALVATLAHSCQARTISIDTVDPSGPHRIRVQAAESSCIGTIGGCRFEARATVETS